MFLLTYDENNVQSFYKFKVGVQLFKFCSIVLKALTSYFFLLEHHITWKKFIYKLMTDRN